MLMRMVSIDYPFLLFLSLKAKQITSLFSSPLPYSRPISVSGEFFTSRTIFAILL